MSFTNAPVTRSLAVSLVGTSIAASLFDIKHYFYIFADSHIWHYHQLWRPLTYQLCYINSSEVLFACVALYQLRVVERMWGSRKFASFLIVTSIFTAIIPPVLISLLQPLTASYFNYLPAGPTSLIFAILAQYYAIIPHIYRYRVATSSPKPPPPPTDPSSSSSTTNNRPGDDDSFSGLTFSDKSYRYLLPLQLAVFQFPASLITAPVGWALGYAWRSGLFPSRLTSWRLPGWLVGASSQKPSAQFEGLRRRLEDEDITEATTAIATGVQGAEGRGEGGPQRRTVTQAIFQQFL
ncbi:hypothetical protein SAPIO_CDS2861 [Scedosporium apiospermum]|uniref:Uncharacterized protein n=1 Tax=Pseudallescheria apiosperma TaxID=563466 RepID=A0A084GBQ1_PSEDA|nr:uncharacterized protein SAPIO_CDS2861 [Scedosporium apiospermum]KEZ44763.1 hypothetical protein SAPIO_CDS2861 [Scedosporium apiospermum]